MTDWFRSWHGAPTDPKWLGIARRAGIAPGIAVAVAWALMDRASQAEDRGSIAGYDADGLAYFFGCEPEQVNAIVAAMTDKGMIADERLTSWERRQPKREDNAAERARDWRERKRTQANADKRPDTDTDTDIAPNGAKRASAPTPRQELETVLDAERAQAIIEHRQRIRAPLTANSARKLAAKLAKWRDANEAADEMLANGWRGFEPEWLENRKSMPRAGPAPPSHMEQVNAILDQMQGKSNEHPTIDASFERTDWGSAPNLIQFDAASSRR